MSTAAGLQDVQPTADRERLKVLVIEDDDAIAKLITMIIEKVDPIPSSVRIVSRRRTYAFKPAGSMQRSSTWNCRIRRVLRRSDVSAVRIRNCRLSSSPPTMKAVSRSRRCGRVLRILFLRAHRSLSCWIGRCVIRSSASACRGNWNGKKHYSNRFFVMCPTLWLCQMHIAKSSCVTPVSKTFLATIRTMSSAVGPMFYMYITKITKKRWA